MSRKTGIRSQYEKTVRAAERLNREIQMEKARRVLAAMMKTISDSTKVTKCLIGMETADGRILGKCIIENFDELISRSSRDMKLQHEKKEREAKKKAQGTSTNVKTCSKKQ